MFFIYVVVLFFLLGLDKVQVFYDGIVEKNVVVVDGNFVVWDLVVVGKMDFGLIDIDDVCLVIEWMFEIVVVVFLD